MMMLMMENGKDDAGEEEKGGAVECEDGAEKDGPGCEGMIQLVSVVMVAVIARECRR